MIKGFSLIYALVISVIAALISGSVMMLAYMTDREINLLGDQERLILNVTSGINILLVDTSSIGSIYERVIDLFDEGKDSVQIKSMSWAMYEVGVVKSFTKNKELTKVVMIGTTLQMNSLAALYLTDQNQPLALCGNTMIKGNCFLPKAGVKMAYIEGKTFIHKKLINGKVRKSKNNLPKINPTQIASLRSILNQQDIKDKNRMMYGWDDGIDSLSNSFELPTKYFYSNRQISLLDQYLEGNIIIYSDESVCISKVAGINDIIVAAPVIKVEEGFKGKVQLIATDSILLAKNCTLNYPSTLSLIKDDRQNIHSYIKIERGSRVVGSVFAYRVEKYFMEPTIFIDKNVIITGEVYVDGVVELKGKIYGNLTCNKFFLKTTSSIYENHLLDATIDYSRLSEHFVGGLFLENKQNKGIVKYLN